jgi:hypothetical protein
MRRVEEYFAQALAGPHADQETISRPHFYKDVRKTLQHLHHDHGCAKSSGCNRCEHGPPLVGKREQVDLDKKIDPRTFCRPFSGSGGNQGVARGER